MFPVVVLVSLHRVSCHVLNLKPQELSKCLLIQQMLSSKVADNEFVAK